MTSCLIIVMKAAALSHQLTKTIPLSALSRVPAAANLVLPRILQTLIEVKGATG